MRFGWPKNGVLTEVIDLPDGTTLNDAFVKSIATQFVVVPDTAEQGWVQSGNTWVAPPPAVLPLATLASELSGAAATACQSLTSQIIPDQTHQNAFINAANMVQANGGNPPTVDPAMSAFNAIASSFGKTPTEFAKIVEGISAVSLQLTAALTSCRAACAAATSTSDLQAALNSFEGALTGIVSAIESSGVTVTAPPAISIAGINA